VDLRRPTTPHDTSATDDALTQRAASRLTGRRDGGHHEPAATFRVERANGVITILILLPREHAF
jgi:hypothetical protein